MSRPHFRLEHRDGVTYVICNLCGHDVTKYPTRRPNAYWVIPAKSAHQCPDEEKAA